MGLTVSLAPRPGRPAGRGAVFLLTLTVVLAGVAADARATSDCALRRAYAGEDSLDQFGFATAGAGDVNGDGFADFLVGANVNDEAAPAGGKAYLFLGGTELPAAPALTFAGPTPAGWAGHALAGGADLDADGYADWVVGAPGPGEDLQDPGRVYVFGGGPSPSGAPVRVLRGEAPGGQFGAAVCLLRDWDGDGYADLFIGAPRAGGGRVYAFRGGAAGVDSLPDLVLRAGPADGRFGRALARLPDLDGDDRDELLVGAPRSNRGATWAGAVLLYRGSAVLDTVPELVLPGATAGEEFGSALDASGDVTGDGWPDIAVGAPLADAGFLTDAGRVDVFAGGPALDGLPAASFNGAAPDAQSGYSVALGCDWNGDGHADLVAGAPDGSVPGSGEGGLRVVFGGPAFPVAGGLVVAGPAPGSHLGMSATAAGDLLRHGRAALLAGGYDAADAGRVLLYDGPEAPVAVGDGAGGPARTLLGLDPPRPNPFNPRTTIAFALAGPARATVDIFGIGGRRVVRLLDRDLGAGRWRVTWNGQGDDCRPVPSGSYLCRVRAGREVSTRKLTLLK